MVNKNSVLVDLIAIYLVKSSGPYEVVRSNLVSFSSMILNQNLTINRKQFYR